VSYPLGRHLYEKCGAERKWFYDNSRDRAGVLEAFKREGGVLFAPSMDRGVDFPGDECTVVVVAKIPYPNLKDPVVSGKLNSGMRGKVWYSTQAVRGLLQMTGRHVRSVEDVGVTYVLDSNFKRLFRDRAKFPKWWRSAVRFKRVRAR
jgi:ATP-dependent DNA helicase DinG